MSVNGSSQGDGDAFQESEINIPRSVRFWLLLIFYIPSICCSFFLLFHLLIKKTLRSQLTNHIIIILLFIGLIIELIRAILLLGRMVLDTKEISSMITLMDMKMRIFLMEEYM